MTTESKLKTYTITTNSGRETHKNITADKLFMAIPPGFQPAGRCKSIERSHPVFKRKVGPDAFETLTVIED